MLITTIKLSSRTKEELNKFKEYRNESYDEVIQKMVYILKKIQKEPKISQKALRQIQEARKRMKEGQYVTLEDARKKLGFC